MEVSDRILARLFMGVLWRGHDAGGISMGRSYRNRLLEAAMVLISLPEDVARKDYDYELLKTELERRKVGRPKKFANQLPLSHSLQFLTDDNIVFLLLLEMLAWYRKAKDKYEFYCVTERRLTESAVLLLEPYGRLPKSYVYDVEDLLREADERKYNAIRADWKWRDRNMGIFYNGSED